MAQQTQTLFGWTEKIKSNSRVLDPLGIEYHLRIQKDYVPGITSVTRRMRYYTLQSWFFKNQNERVKDPHKLERLFILATLAHHGGDSSHPSIKHVFNKQYFENDWQTLSSFPLTKEFKIQGFGRTYYVRQLEIFRSAWFDGIKTRTTPINDKLSSTITIDDSHLDKDIILKEDLSKYERLCICDSETNQEEIDIFSRILFGFIKYTRPEELEESIVEKYTKEELNLDFYGIDDYPLEEFHKERNIRRRNTLFLFLKIIDEVNPAKNEWRNTIMDAVYFKQNSETLKTIEFGRLEKIGKYWEVHQFLIYYVFCCESILDVLQMGLRKNVDGVKMSRFLEILDKNKIENHLTNLLGSNVKLSQSISEIKQILNKLVGEDFTTLKSSINERILLNSLYGSKTNEEKLTLVLLLLILLRKRLDHLPTEILKNYSTSESSLVFDELNVINIMKDFDNSDEVSIQTYLEKLIEKVIKKHLFESARRYRYRTKNWVFTEDNGYLYPSGRRLVRVNDKNNRWNPIFNLLLDTKMIQASNDVTLTTKGKSWLQMIE